MKTRIYKSKIQFDNEINFMNKSPGGNNESQL